MERYLDTFVTEFGSYARYLAHELTHPGPHSYVYGLVAVSLAVYLIECIRPWRPDQPRIRPGFWGDLFYVFFNFFLFSLLGYHAVASVVEQAVRDGFAAVGVVPGPHLDVSHWPVWTQWLVLFVARDFIQYWIHRGLHAAPPLWRVHQVHHSVQVMGFAAHMRFHPLETVFYRSLEYLPLSLIGFGVQDFFVVHMTALTIGHLNHANFRLPLGPLRYVLNSPQMHLWHHARQLAPAAANFGISLSVWDWLFGTVYWPQDDPDPQLGFEGVEHYPTSFVGHGAAPFRAPD